MYQTRPKLRLSHMYVANTDQPTDQTDRSINRWRNANIVPRAWARIVEPVVVAFVTTTLAVLIPYLFGSCVPQRCKEDPGLPGCNARIASSAVQEEGLVQYACSAEGTYNPAATLFFTNADRTIEQLLSRGTHYQVCVRMFLHIY